jgi:glycosyltransferase involved in cell wall biosynthesis
MRVLHVISGIDPRLGGTAAVVSGLAAAQRDVGLEVAVATHYSPADDRAAAEHLRARGIAVTEIGPVAGRRGRHPDMSGTIRALVSESHVVHIHGLWEEIEHHAASAAQTANVPYVIAPHGMLDPWSLRQGRWKKWLYMRLRLRRHLNRAAALHFTSVEERERTAALRLRPRAIVEPNGIDLREFDALPPAGTARQRHDVPPGLAFLFLGRLHPKKGLDLLIPAFARAALPEASLVIAGPADSGAYQAELARLVMRHGIESRCILTGMLHGVDRLALLADADLLVLPSRQENFGIVVAEALACGTPVLVSDQVNIHRDVRDAGVGAVFPLEVDAIARELKRWGTDGSLRRSAARRAAAFARARYDWAAIACRWIEHYGRLSNR